MAEKSCHNDGGLESIKFLFIGIICLLISVILGFHIFEQSKEYARQAAIMDDIKDRVVSTIPSGSDTGSNIQTTPIESAPPEPTLPSIPEETEPERIYIDANFLRKVDFEELQSINSDASRWVYIPDTPIDACVMQEQTVGQYYYLYKDIYKNYSSVGSLLTPKIPLDSDDAHSLIFGHTFSYNRDFAFGSIKIHFADADVAAKHPYVYVYYPDHVERWQTWAVCDAHSYDLVYDIPYTIGSDEYGAMLNDMAVKARYQLCDQPDVWTRTLFLSTCNGRVGGSNVRLVLACVPDAAYYYDTKEVKPFGHEAE